MQTLQLEMPDELMDLLGDDEQPMERAVLELILLDLYRRRRITSGRAAELLEVDQFAFIRRASSLGIPYFDLTKEELEEELQTLETLCPSR